MGRTTRDVARAIVAQDRPDKLVGGLNGFTLGVRAVPLRHAPNSVDAPPLGAG